MGEPPLRLIVTGTIAAVLGGLILAWLLRNQAPSTQDRRSTTEQTDLRVAF
jgi:hypothetical protein